MLELNEVPEVAQLLATILTAEPVTHGALAVVPLLAPFCLRVAYTCFPRRASISMLGGLIGSVNDSVVTAYRAAPTLRPRLRSAWRAG